MTHDELIAKAKEHAEAIERGGGFAATVSEFANASVRDAAIVYFRDSTREDHIEYYLDAATGDFITATYSPEK